VLEAENLTVPRVDARHGMLVCTIADRRIHRLKDQLDRVAVRDVVKRLLLCDKLDMAR